MVFVAKRGNTMIELYFDGSCEPKNPGGHATLGYWITGEGIDIKEYGYLGKGIITISSGIKVQTTNNIAEYSALVYGLTRCSKDLPADCCLRIYGDSKLVVEQVNGNWRCNKDYLRCGIEKSRALLKEFNDWELAWIPRERNVVADKLSRDAYHSVTGKWPPERKKR